MTTTQQSASAAAETENRSRRQRVQQTGFEVLAFVLAIAAGVALELLVFDLLSSGPRLAPGGAILLGLVVGVPVGVPLPVVWKRSIRGNGHPAWFETLLIWTAATLILALELTLALLLSGSFSSLTENTAGVLVIALAMLVPSVCAYFATKTSIFATSDTTESDTDSEEVSDGG